MLGTRTQDGKMEGADESTELWRHPKLKFFGDTQRTLGR